MKLQKVKCESNWSIYNCARSYIVRNKTKEFDDAHCHVSSLKTANDIVLMCRLKKTPRNWHPRILVSLARVADDDHAKEIKQLIAEKLKKSKQKYNNQPRGCV